MSTLFQVAIAPGSYLFPFRTEKSSPVTPMVLHTRGRVGRRHFRESPRANALGTLFFVSVPEDGGCPAGDSLAQAGGRMGLLRGTF